MKNRLIAGFLLLALLCWAFPLPVSGSTAETVPLHEPHAVQEIKPTNEQNTEEPKPLETTVYLAKNHQPTLDLPADRLPYKEIYSGQNYSKEEVVQLIKDYSAQYGISSNTPMCIANLESGYNQFSKNRSSSASGVFQYLTGTWTGTDEGKLGLSVFDADANVKAAVKYMAIHKSTSPWSVAPNCPPLSLTK